MAERQQKLGWTLQELQRIAWQKDLAVVFTNQVIATPYVFGKGFIPTGGHVLAHKAQYRFLIRRGKGNIRVFRVIDAPDLIESEVLVKVTEKGIE